MNQSLSPSKQPLATAGLGACNVAPSPLSEVQQELCQLESIVSHLGDELTRIYDRTVSVRREYPQTPPSNSTVPQPVLVPLADRLQNLKVRLQAITAGLSECTDSIQL